MQRVRKFLIVKEHSPLGRRLTQSVLSAAIPCEGWHQSWDTAVRLMGTDHSASGADGTDSEIEVAIADESVSLQVIAIFSPRNLESLEQVGRETRWRSVRIAAGDGCWCNLNYSDYGWGWVSGAKREVPFRLRFFERQAESNPNSLISRARAWILEARDWFYGHDKKIS
jgi:hypothetical protein